MKKLVTLASVGVFLLSLQGASLAQEKAPATPNGPATTAGPATAAPSVTGPVEMPANPEVTGVTKTKKAKKKTAKKKTKTTKKKTKKAQKPKVVEE